MHTFKDGQGRTWHVDIDLQTEADVKASCDVYLSDISGEAENSTLARLETDSLLLGRVLEVLCSDEIKEYEETQFLKLFKGKVLDDAREAVIEETLDFLGHRGASIRKVRTERIRIEQEMEAKNVQGLQELTGEQAFALLNRVQILLPHLDDFIDSDGNLAEKSESTREDLSSDNSSSCQKEVDEPVGV